MGSYATLSFGHFAVGEWKSYVPLEPLLLFTQEDLREEPKTTEDDYEYTSRKFVVTASVAKHRLDSRGFNLAACRRLFDEFRSDIIWEFDPQTGEDRYIPNTVDFDQYLATCARTYQQHDNLYFISDSDDIDDLELKLVFGEDFFDGTTMQYFRDAKMCVVMRAFLEAAPPEAPVVFDLTELVQGGYLDADEIPRIYDHFTKLMLRRIGLDYQLYGFVIHDDPGVDQRLRSRIDDLSEDHFIDHILLPLLDRMGFQRIRKVRFHGRNEFGSDVLPFRYRTPLGTLEYYAVQAKAVPDSWHVRICR